jgi:cytidylate kinase
MSNIVIAIDGPAASGKGTISKAISEKLQFNYLDTGKLYRAIGARYLEGYPPIVAAQSLDSKDLDKYDLQKQEIAQAASEIALIPEVRAALLKFQRDFSQKMPGAVLDGRDIGTIV